MSDFTALYYRTVKIKRLSIIGLGLIGGATALAVRANINTIRITGYDVARAAARAARRRGMIDRIATCAVDAVNEADLVILSAPPLACCRLLGDISPHLSDDAVVTDVCGCKGEIVAAAGRTLRDRGRRFVGAHPMFGSERSGLRHAAAVVTAGARCILTPTRYTSAEALAAVRTFWRRLGLNVIAMSPDAHDRAIAAASHLPQLIASLTAARQTKASLSIAGRGLLNTTRLADSDAALWCEIALANRMHLARALVGYASHLEKMAAGLTRGDASMVRTVMAAGKRNREKLRTRLPESTR